jgi:hypothetical protein
MLRQRFAEDDREVARKMAALLDAVVRLLTVGGYRL